MSKKQILKQEEIPGKVQEIINRAAKHEYKASEIYAVHNAVFKLNKPVKLCATCLRNRVRDLKRWQAEQAAAQEAEIAPVVGPGEDPNNPGFEAPAKGVTRYTSVEGDLLDVDGKGKARPARMIGEAKVTLAKGIEFMARNGEAGFIKITTNSKGEAKLEDEPAAPATELTPGEGGEGTQEQGEGQEGPENEQGGEDLI